MSNARSTIIGLGELKAQFGRIAKSMRGNMLAKAATSGLLLVENAAVQKAPKRTRTLARSIHTEILDQKDTSVEAAVGTDVIYAAVMEFGKVITPKKAKMLHWVDEAGNDVFARKVTIKPHPYLRPAWDEKEDAMIQEVKDSLIDLIKAAV